jgi:biotin carboxylase
VLNNEAISEWAARVPPPWVLKPRSQAAAIGIRKLHGADELWPAIDALGEAFAEYVLEQFIPGEVYHVDSIVFDRQVRFAIASRYSTPPMTVAHEGGIFATRTLHPSSPLSAALLESNARVLASFGLVRGASHTEFIRAESGDWYFLETSARVGGAFIVDVVEAATGLNLWREWAKVEIAGEDGRYEPAAVRQDCGGIVLSLARQEYPDLSAYTDPEIVVRVRKSHHAGVIVASPSAERVDGLLEEYTRRFYADFHASAPPPARAPD